MYKSKLIRSESWAMRPSREVQYRALRQVNELVISLRDKDLLDGEKTALLALNVAEKLVPEVRKHETYIRRSLKYDTSRLDFKTVLTQYVFNLMCYCMFKTR